MTWSVPFQSAPRMCLSAAPPLRPVLAAIEAHPAPGESRLSEWNGMELPLLWMKGHGALGTFFKTDVTHLFGFGCLNPNPAPRL